MDEHTEGLNHSLSLSDDSLVADRYQIHSVIGEGSCANVYLAFDVLLERRVALKVLREKISQAATASGSFLDEARALALVEHPNIAKIFDVGVLDSGQHYIVSQYIDGITLEVALTEGSLSIDDLLKHLLHIAEALAAVHEAGLIHRDITPVNIVISLSGEAHLIDFGIVFAEWNIPWLTAAGTPGYMSPEQFSNEEHLIDTRSDIYSLGAILFRGLSGSAPPDPSSSALEYSRAHLSHVSPSLRRICLKAMSHHPSDRYPTALSFRKDLEQDPVQPKREFSCKRSTRVFPRGLKPFRAIDAEAYLQLLPGPRDPSSGLPVSVEKWKHRLEEPADGISNTLRVGVLHGPSGSGKSSFLAAGLVPQLAPSYLAINLNADSSDTIRNLKRKIRKQFPHLEKEAGLPWLLGSLRRGSLPTGRKLLIVIDQFEQYLQSTAPDLDNDPMVKALKQCDGERIQAVLSLRDDFWRSMSNFMEALDIPMQQGRNLDLIQPLSPTHAANVLETLAKAYGIINDRPTASQSRFISKAVKILAQSHEIIPIHLAVLTQLFSQQDWHPDQLQGVANLEDLGVQHLTHLFEGVASPSTIQEVQSHILSFLTLLLPKTGSNLKRTSVASKSIQQSLGLNEHPRTYQEIIRILDQDLRLITLAPVERQESYQLAHDYLVPTLKHWLALRDGKSLRSIAKSRLENQAVQWSHGDTKKLRPSLTEWLWFRTLTRHRDRSATARRYLRAPTRSYLFRGACVISLIFLLAVAFHFQISRAHADEAFREMLYIQPGQISAHLSRHANHRSAMSDLAREHLVTTPLSSSDQWRCALLLADTAPASRRTLFDHFLSAPVSDLPPILDSLHSSFSSFEEELLSIVREEVRPSSSLRAACFLANASPEKATKDLRSKRVTSWLLNESHHPVWEKYLTPIGSKLSSHLLEAIRDGDQIAVPYYLSFNGMAATAIETCLKATTKENHPVLARELLLRNTDPPSCLPNSQLFAPCMALQILNGNPDFLRIPAARNEPEVLYLAQGVSVAQLNRFLNRPRLPSRWHQRLLQLLSQKELTDLTRPQRTAILHHLHQVALPHADPGIHSAARLVLTHWKLPIPKIKPPQDGSWDYFSDLEIEMIIVEPDSPLVNGATKFAIASTELTITQRKILDSSFPPADAEAPGSLVTTCRSTINALRICNALSVRVGLTPCYIDLDGQFHLRNDYLQCEGFRLPTPSEWDFVSSDPTNLRSHQASPAKILDPYLWHLGNTNDPRSIGLTFPNHFGLFDLWGSFRELTLLPTEHSSSEGFLAKHVIMRGGSYRADLPAILLDSHHQHGSGKPTHPKTTSTLRLVRSLPP